MAVAVDTPLVQTIELRHLDGADFDGIRAVELHRLSLVNFLIDSRPCDLDPSGVHLHNRSLIPWVDIHAVVARLLDDYCAVWRIHLNGIAGEDVKDEDENAAHLHVALLVLIR